MAELPILRRFPALARLRRAEFGQFPTPCAAIPLTAGRVLLVKRDDLSGATIGGNKVRGLEWVLGGGEGRDLLTVGARGSTHALTTALLGARLGVGTTVVRWEQEMNAAAHAVDRRLSGAARVIDARVVPAAYAVAAVLRMGGARWIPAGGTTTEAIIGHTNAGLELAEQVTRGECERPDGIFVPLGTGGTAAGIALGLRLADLAIPVIAVRVVPRLVAGKGRILGLAARTRSLIQRATSAPLPRLDPRLVHVEHGYYAGAYGRPFPTPSSPGEDRARAAGVRLDDTYSRKAFIAAERSAMSRPLVWLTFDGRLLQD